MRGLSRHTHLLEVGQQTAHHARVDREVPRDVVHDAHVLAQRALRVQALLQVLSVRRGLQDRVLGSDTVVQQTEDRSVPKKRRCEYG